MSIGDVGFTAMTTKCIELARAYQADFFYVEGSSTPAIKGAGGGGGIFKNLSLLVLRTLIRHGCYSDVFIYLTRFPMFCFLLTLKTIK
jgi:hypothetical protein